ncbi:MAG TPA: hypothetical protein DDW55_06285, partial [Gammaproteobacteria bacterium]|nr:hypothetical protein [Gammaproteobacteria bacterium]
KVNIPTGIPLVYELDETLHAQKRYYLGDKRKVEAAIGEVAAQTGQSENDNPAKGKSKGKSKGKKATGT